MTINDYYDDINWNKTRRIFLKLKGERYINSKSELCFKIHHTLSGYEDMWVNFVKQAPFLIYPDSCTVYSIVSFLTSSKVISFVWRTKNKNCKCAYRVILRSRILKQLRLVLFFTCPDLLFVCCYLDWSSTVKMEGVCFSETWELLLYCTTPCPRRRHSSQVPLWESQISRILFYLLQCWSKW